MFEAESYAPKALIEGVFFLSIFLDKQKSVSAGRADIKECQKEIE